MGESVTLYPGAASRVMFGGQAVVALYGPMVGGFIYNPSSSSDQGVPMIEPIYVDITGIAAVNRQTATCVVVQPGGTFVVPPGQLENVSVNAVTGGHKFSAISVQPAVEPPKPRPEPPDFPPPVPTALLKVIPSYLYQEYNEDDDLQGFVDAYNQITQAYIDWFVSINLPVYTQEKIGGALLDWVAEGIYGMSRPTLSSGIPAEIGPFNTYGFNVMPMNYSRKVGPSDVAATSDDVFRRILTWHLWRGDGRNFSVRWLKRRILRFLYGVDGADYPKDQTPYQISVTFGVGNQINITIVTGARFNVQGCFNTYGMNVFPMDFIRTEFVTYNEPPMAKVFKEAMDSGALEMPFQYDVITHIGT